MKTSSSVSEQTAKESFKKSVGLQASGWGVSVSASHAKETGSETSSSQASSSQQERNVFEAVGGNTILASK